MGRRVVRVAAACALALGVVCGAAPPSGAVPVRGAAVAVPIARHVTSVPAVGALFVPGALGLAPALGLPHYCSGAVLGGAGHDLVITAAHCVYGTGLGIEFAPGFHDGISPHGVWDVDRAYVPPQWLADQDPHYDVAVLHVHALGTAHLDALVHGYRPGSAPVAGSTVTVDGYPAGSGGTPITCTARTFRTSGYPAFDCGGFVDGVSGGPWLAGGRVVGVTGGLHQGGCTPSTSYSAPFGAAVSALVTRASRGGAGDLAPLPGSDGC